MNVFVNRGVRRLFLAAGVLALVVIITGQVLVWLAVNDYKNALIAHDAALAGALMQQGLEPAEAAAIFTAPKTEAQRAVGRQVLEQAGVSEDLNYRFVPEATAFLQRYSTAVLLLGLLFSAGAMVGLAFFFTCQGRQVERASQAIERFMQAGERGGDRREIAGLVDGSLDEGSLAQLFNAINAMAASLTAHIQKEQRDREFLKETISDISHQLKTPLSALQMYTEIIRDECPADPMVVDFTQRSERELNRMEYLIQNLLKLARLDAGTISLKTRPLVLAAFLAETLESFSTRARMEAKQVRLICPDEVRLDGDEHWLSEAVSNLVKNAFDHTTTGGQIEVVCEETPLMVTVAVRDDGSGIHPEDLPYVFKRFYRSRFSQDHQGVGIGLTLARSIVDRHGGSIVVESELGQGAVFRLIFPKLTNM